MSGSKKPRILYIIESLSFGGVERRRLSLVKRLTDDYDVALICSQTVGNLHQEFQKLDVPVHQVGILGFPWRLQVIRETLKVARQFQPDIIHGAVFEGVTLANICGWFMPGVKVISEETSDPQNRGKKGTMLLKWLTRRSAVVVGVSESVADYLRGVVQAKKVLQINNGVEDGSLRLEKPRGTYRDEMGFAETDFVVGFVGRLRDVHKRVSDLIKAADLLFKKYDHLKLLIVGGGFDEEQLKEQAAHTAMPGSIRFVGMQDNPNPYYATMDTFCIPSHMEAFGLVLVEAMFHNLPVVATNVGGMKEIVLPEVTGYLVERHQPEAIASALEKLILNEDLCRDMGEKGRSRALNSFGADRYVSEVKGLYEKLLA